MDASRSRRVPCPCRHRRITSANAKVTRDLRSCKAAHSLEGTICSFSSLKIGATYVRSRLTSVTAALLGRPEQRLHCICPQLRVMIQSVCQIEANPHQFLARRSAIGAVGAPSQTFQKLVLRARAQLADNSKTQVTSEKFRAFKS